MGRTGSAPEDPALRTLAQELDIVRGAVEMVASGGSPRSVIGSLRFGDELIEPARRMAIGTRVRIVPIWTTDEAGAALAIERTPDD